MRRLIMALARQQKHHAWPADVRADTRVLSGRQIRKTEVRRRIAIGGVKATRRASRWNRRVSAGGTNVPGVGTGASDGAAANRGGASRSPVIVQQGRSMGPSRSGGQQAIACPG